MKPLFFAIVAAGMLSACSTTPRTPYYECALDDVKSAKCASMEDTYRASRTMNRGEHGRVQSVFDGRVQADAANSARSAPMFTGQPSNYPEPGQQGAPVFQQPKVMRVWVAPYVDADGNLRSGEYTYFSTPGQWNYGTMNKPGAAAGIFEPSKPGNLGFNPVLEKGKTLTGSNASNNARPSAPPEVQSAARNAQAQGATNQPAAAQATDSSGTITQPYQRLSN